MKKWVFRISILLNIVLLIGWGLSCLNRPSYKLGRLEKDITIGNFMGDSLLFKLPKGLTVRNASERGISAIGLTGIALGKLNLDFGEFNKLLILLTIYVSSLSCSRFFNL
jgi:hypothetical protein